MPDGPNFLGKRGDICERRMVDPRAEASGEKGHEATGTQRSGERPWVGQAEVRLPRGWQLGAGPGLGLCWPDGQRWSGRGWRPRGGAGSSQAPLLCASFLVTWTHAEGFWRSALLPCSE